MSVHPSVLAAIEALAAEVQALDMAHAVQRSAYVALALHLQRQGHVQLPVLVQDLRMLASAQPDEGWKDGHLELAAVLNAVRVAP